MLDAIKPLLDSQLINESTGEAITEAFEAKLNTLESKYTSTINQLQIELNKSKAFPTMPDKKADPKLNIQKKINTDDSGKVLLQNIPDSAKRKLKSKIKNQES